MVSGPIPSFVPGYFYSPASIPFRLKDPIRSGTALERSLQEPTWPESQAHPVTGTEHGLRSCRPASEPGYMHSLSHAKPQFPHLLSGAANSHCLTALFKRLEEPSLLKTSSSQTRAPHTPPRGDPDLDPPSFRGLLSALCTV